MEGRISGLFIYPVKSCAALSLNEAQCGLEGLQHDREWVIVNEEGRVLTQRDHARMALIRPRFDATGSLILAAPDCAPCVVSSSDNKGESLAVNLWGETHKAVALDIESGEWLSRFLGVECRLLRSARAQGTAVAGGSFTDCWPVSVIAENSLAQLNDKLEEPVMMDRFRPSIVLSGIEPHAEDSVGTITIGPVKLRQMAPVVRCVIVTIDQAKGWAASNEPMRTLSTYRGRGGKVLFGHYFQAEQPGLLRVGDPVSAEVAVEQ
jgi:uncharacterized protein